MSHILIVEDDRDIAEGIRFNLALDGHEVHVIGDGAAALARLREERDQFDAVVLDIMLPGSDGWNLLREIRADRSCANTKVLMLSVLDERKRAFKDGADGFILKPLDRDHLLQVIDEVVGAEDTPVQKAS